MVQIQEMQASQNFDTSHIRQELRLNVSLASLNLNLSLLFEYHILLPTPFLKAIGRSKCIFHELHVCHLAIFTDLTPNGKWADRHLSQRSRAIGKFAKDRYILPSAEEGLDLEGFIGPDPVDGGKGINDSLGAG